MIDDADYMREKARRLHARGHVASGLRLRGRAMELAENHDSGSDAERARRGFPLVIS